MSALGHTAETTDDPAYYRAAYRQEREKHEALRADLALRIQEWEHCEEEAQQPGPIGVAARRGFVVAAREVRRILDPDPTESPSMYSGAEPRTQLLDLAAIRDMASRGVALLPQDGVILLECVDARDRRIRDLEETVGELRDACTKASEVLAPHTYASEGPQSDEPPEVPGWLEAPSMQPRREKTE